MATVAELQDDAQKYADLLGTKIDGLINTLIGYSADTVHDAGSVAWAGTNYTDIVTGRLQDLIGTKPTAPNIADPNATVPTMPAIAAIAAPADVVVPEFSAAAPSINIPATPSFVPPTEPGAAPALVQPTIPDAPSYALPDVPTFQSLVVPIAPSVTIPSFTAVAPNVTLTAPTNNFAFAETPYASELLDQLDAKLLSDLENGGYGIETVDELMLLDRAAERESEAAERTIADASKDYAQRRFELPPGALLETIQRSREALATASNTLSREIALKRYDQFVAARQFAIQQGVALENIRMTFYGAMMERLLNAARYTADAAVAYFNAQVEGARLSQQQYQTAAAVFETLVRAKVEELNVYKTQLEAERLKGDLDRIKVENYRAQIEGVRATAEIYNLRMRAAEIQQGVERLKLEGYRTAIDAYIATVKGKEIVLQAFEAQVRGEEAKAKVYESQARGFEAVVRGKEVAANIARTKVLTQVETVRSQLETLDGQIKLYRATYEGQVGIQNLHLTKFTAESRNFEANTNAVATMGRLAIENLAANREDFLGVLRHNLDKAKYLLAIDESNRNWRGDVTAKAISFYAPIASAALSAINTLGVQTTTS